MNVYSEIHMSMWSSDNSGIIDLTEILYIKCDVPMPSSNDLSCLCKICLVAAL